MRRRNPIVMVMSMVTILAVDTTKFRTLIMHMEMAAGAAKAMMVGKQRSSVNSYS
jgi:hypothetical protein